VKRHVHRRPDGLVVLCVRPWCAPGWRKATIRRALLIAVPFAVVAASATTGLPRLAIALGAVAAIALAVRATMALGARIDRDAVASDHGPAADDASISNGVRGPTRRC
jgi:hypothetical protein